MVILKSLQVFLPKTNKFLGRSKSSKIHLKEDWSIDLSLSNSFLLVSCMLDGRRNFALDCHPTFNLVVNDLFCQVISWLEVKTINNKVSWGTYKQHKPMSGNHENETPTRQMRSQRRMRLERVNRQIFKKLLLLKLPTLN